jgi:3',5'-cyclic AMP phosphodiesterase CpdA
LGGGVRPGRGRCAGDDDARAAQGALTRLVHLTDLHFGAEDPAIVTALVADIRAAPPDLVVISGDLTQNALMREYAAARAFIDSLGVQCLVVPGNHDLTPYWLWERFLAPYARWHATIAAEIEPNWRDDTVAVLGVNSTRPAGLHYNWAHGRITRRRLARLVARLDAVPAGLLKIVVTHHPLLRPHGERWVPVVGGAARALAAFAAHGVGLVLAGHLHRFYGRPGGPGGRPPLVLQGSTSTSVRLRGEPNSYARIDLVRGSAPVITVRAWAGHEWVDRPLCVDDGRISTAPVIIGAR